MKISLTKPQLKVSLSKARFRVLISGRRFGKTYLCITEMMKYASNLIKKYGTLHLHLRWPKKLHGQL